MRKREEEREFDGAGQQLYCSKLDKNRQASKWLVHIMSISREQINGSGKQDDVDDDDGESAKLVSGGGDVGDESRPGGSSKTFAKPMDDKTSKGAEMNSDDQSDKSANKNLKDNEKGVVNETAEEGSSAARSSGDSVNNENNSSNSNENTHCIDQKPFG